MNPKLLMEKLLQQLSLDFNCTPADLRAKENRITVSALREGRRIYYRLDCEKLGGMHKNLMQIFSGGMDCDCCRNAAQPFAVEEAPPREGDA